MNDRLVERRRDQWSLTTDRRRIDQPAVLAMLNRSHWGASVTADNLSRAIENSVCVSIFDGERQLAFARAVTDLATYAYLTDVIVADDARGRGLGTWMVEEILAHPDLQGLRRFALLTRDAQTLYERFGFSTRMATSTYMEKRIQANASEAVERKSQPL
jgi:N-acetylglutamate synthase-like GNAT family acetyltransferase